MACIKRFTSLTPKKDIGCAQIFALFLLFFLGSLAASMTLLSTMIVWTAEGNLHKDGHVVLETAEDRAVDTFKFMLKF